MVLRSERSDGPEDLATLATLLHDEVTRLALHF